MANPSLKWARAEVAGCGLPDLRLRNRAAVILGDLGRRVAGTVTGSVRRPAKREAAYRFVENARVSAMALVLGAAAACLQRATGDVFVVALDFCYLTLLGAASTATGPIGTSRQAGLQGLVAMTGLAMTPAGTPLGLCYQALFARSWRRRLTGPCPRCKKRWQRWQRQGRPGARRSACSHREEARKALPLAQKETRFWVEAMEYVVTRCREQGTSARPWFQCDRGGDFWDLLQWASDHLQTAWVTIRCNSDRRLREGERVRQHLKSRKVLYTAKIQVPSGRNRLARTAEVQVRADQVTVAYRRRAARASLGVVWVHEVGPVPRGQSRLDWVLWTTHPITRRREVKAVVESYELRWGIEEFHKTWKSVCGIEKTQLRSLPALQVWSTLLAMAAARIQRLLKRAREEPKVPAAEEFSEDELNALVALSGASLSASPLTLAKAVNAIAVMGGYTGKSSGGPPGPITLGRGLEDLRVAAAVVAALRQGGHLKKM